ncbi:hypothetical protein MTR67_034339 [Solanum verrucosum]|uniref:Chromo domain-containing protein n=1 Tax=Solanum verrucosum TaxID=315347 RepID=A0AAF0ZL79_SOLVR|nr:hypothetical protein MTR67_034339 [Solanum verrucosum]
MRECPKNRQGNGGNKAQFSSFVPPDRTAPRRATSSAGGGANRLYAITSRHEQENSPNVVTGMIKVFTFNVYALLDPGASLSFVTPYVANQFEVLPERLCEPFCVSTPIGESILAERVYRDCPVSISHKNTKADLVELDMVPVQILDRQVRRLRTKDVASVKVLWRNQFVEEATWEAEKDMKKRYPHLFESADQGINFLLSAL